MPVGVAAPTDWEHGDNHPPTRHATAFSSDAAAVYAEMAVWDYPAGRQTRADADAGGGLAFEVSVAAKEVFGQSFRDHVRGWTRVGSQSNPAGVQPTEFPDDTVIVALYRHESVQDEWRAYTC